MLQPIAQRPAVIASVDIEDWPQSTWDHSLEITDRARENTERILDVLAERGTKVTMFVLGKFAEKCPNLVKRMAQEGHEVASHGHGHIEILRQTREQFQADVRRSKSFLEDLLGVSVLGYRAPDFSIVEETRWALEVLAELGFKYDSSIFPIKHKRYGIDWWPPYPARIQLPNEASIVEVPVGTIQALGRQWPVGGGGYHRLLPWALIRWSILHTLRSGNYFVTYCHPYELDVKEFEELGFEVPWKTRLHQGLGRRGFRKKFERILESFEVVQAVQIIDSPQLPAYVPPVARDGLN